MSDDAAVPPRIDPDIQGGEAELLCAFLDYHRTTFLQKASGLTREQMAQRTGASELTLAGLTKHLALVEDSWFHERYLGQPIPEPWASAPWAEDSDWDFHSAVDDEPDDLLALYVAACDRSRAVIDQVGSLDSLSARPDSLMGRPFSARWVLLHLIEETARHNGHADLLREAVDGRTGE